MMNCIVVQIETPKHYLLDGIWIGPEKAETVFVYVHGLGSNLFSHYGLLENLASDNTAVLVFNNRGYGNISRIKRLNKKSVKGYDSHWIGMAHEVFTESADDIAGAVGLAENKGAKQVFLVGHSTGCQKSVYYLTRPHHQKIAGAVLLAPMSDFADTLILEKKKIYTKATVVAEKMIQAGKGRELLPSSVWSFPMEAQRFVSLFTKDSVEEIFGYASNKKPTLLQKVDVPILVMLAGADEYRDREMIEIGGWFEKMKYKNSGAVVTVAGATHGFGGCEKEVVKLVQQWKNKI